jgi:UDP-N-acetylmuramoyl-tripeptide--D-alanyl-D-alanine ligase
MKKNAKKLSQFLAGLILKKYKPKIIAITGSVGKTTTRDFLYNILSKKIFVRKSEKSFTSELGIPLTIIGRPSSSVAFASNTPFFVTVWNFILTLFFALKILFWKNAYPEWLILEIDADKPGDVASVAGLLSVDILVVTAIGKVPSHIESFSSDMDKFLAEKEQLLNALKRDGTLIYNADDEVTCGLVARSDVEKISCGLTGATDFSGSPFEILGSATSGLWQPTGMRFTVEKNNTGKSKDASQRKSTIAIMDSIGVNNEYATLLSVAVADLFDINFSEATKSIEKIDLLPGHMKIIAGLKDSTIIDDSYNSSPIALKQALETFSEMSPSGRKIVVVGDMLELGKFSSEEHREAGKTIATVADYVVCVGLRTRKTAETLLSLLYNEEKISCFDTVEESGEFLRQMIASGDLVLVKGSQSMRLEKAVEMIMRHPEDSKKLLVRQESRWLERE